MIIAAGAPGRGDPARYYSDSDPMIIRGMMPGRTNVTRWAAGGPAAVTDAAGHRGTVDWLYSELQVPSDPGLAGTGLKPSSKPGST
jgi:hypothetical protein